MVSCPAVKVNPTGIARLVQADEDLVRQVIRRRS
jgi:hypothetical protein